MGAVADMSAAYRRVGAVLQPVQARRRLLGLEAERRPTEVRAWRAAAATAPQLQEPGGWQGTCAKAAWPMTGGGGARGRLRRRRERQWVGIPWAGSGPDAVSPHASVPASWTVACLHWVSDWSPSRQTTCGGPLSTSNSLQSRLRSLLQGLTPLCSAHNQSSQRWRVRFPS